jgi:glycosyltransferase involved in cell wall biosynthesis/2-polyprenyl-3-methyl-5-hydroxy-6-metoxy-1,4-benzoquinol methylase
VSNPLVSVVIPCYNHAQYLGEAIESALAQTWLEVESVVVDDGSTDNTPEVARMYPTVRYLRQQNRGLAAARNAGAKAANGTYLIFLDADDRLTPRAVEAGMQCFRENPKAGLVYGAGIGFEETGEFREPIAPIPPGDHPYEHLLRSNYIWMPHMSMYARDVFESVGCYDAGFDATADYALNLKIARSFPIVGHQELVAERRYVADSMSRDYSLMLSSILRVMEVQRPHAMNDPVLSRALRIGIRNWKANFCGMLAESVMAQLRSGQTRPAFRRELTTLMRFGPSAGARMLGRRLRDGLKESSILRSGYYLAIVVGQMVSDDWREPAVFDRLFTSHPDPWKSTREVEAERVRLVMELLDQAHPQPFSNALEIGCAEGIFTALLASRCERLLAVDYSNVALEHAAVRLSPFSNVVLSQVDIRKDDISGKFDLVLAMGVLTYLSRPWDVRKACNKVIEAIEAGGLILFCDTRQSRVFETASWASAVLRGGEQIRRHLSAHPKLTLELAADTETHVFAIFRRNEDEN